LLSAPTAAPIIKNSYAISNTTLYIQWEAPQAETIKGSIVGYKIMYYPLSKLHTLHVRRYIAKSHMALFSEKLKSTVSHENLFSHSSRSSSKHYANCKGSLCLFIALSHG